MRTVRLIVLILLHAALMPNVFARSKLQEDPCASYNSTESLKLSKIGKGCLSTLFDREYAHHFDVCKTNVCFIFKWEGPMVMFDKSVVFREKNKTRFQLPFKCGRPADWDPSLTGYAIELHKRTSTRDEYCVWAGNPSECTWNGLVDFTGVMAGQGYQFAITGPMLETASRKCEHYSSGPWLDNPMIIIGRNEPPPIRIGHQISQLVKPFSPGTWITICMVLVLFVILSFILVNVFHVSGSNSLFTAYMLLVGDGQQALVFGRSRGERKRGRGKSRLRALWNSGRAKEDPNREGEEDPNASQIRPSTASSQNESEVCNEDLVAETQQYRSQYNVATSLFRFSLICFAGLFFLFYEAAVVQFLFHQRRIEITKGVSTLSEEELRSFAVMKDSALEDIWLATVDPGGSRMDWKNKTNLPWKRCSKTEDCIRMVKDGKEGVKFTVTYEVEGGFLIHELSDCDHLTRFDTTESLHYFNAGWLMNSLVDPKKKRQFDRELVALRVNGTVSQLLKQHADHHCKRDNVVSIGPIILLMPIVVLVLPPLILSVMVVFW